MIVTPQAVPRLQFQSTLPARGATVIANSREKQLKFQSTLPARGATATRRNHFSAMKDFNPRSPHGERPETRATNKSNAAGFQSTLPARGATTYRILRGDTAALISIHAPRTGSDPSASAFRELVQVNFNPRSPHGERLIEPKRHIACQRDFNPRSPHGERRLCRMSRSTCQLVNFNPRSPHGERHIADEIAYTAQAEFQSTLPARGATLAVVGIARMSSSISIHAPRTGSDVHSRLVWRAFLTCISIHAPRTGSDGVA